MVCVIVFSKLVSWSFLLQIFKLMLESMTIIFNVLRASLSSMLLSATSQTKGLRSAAGLVARPCSSCVFLRATGPLRSAAVAAVGHHRLGFALVRPPGCRCPARLRCFSP